MTLTDTLYMRSERKWYYSCQAFWCLWCFVSCELAVVLCGDTIALAHRPFRQPQKKKKQKKNIMVDTSLIPFIYFVSERCISKRAKMPALPNVSQINDIPARMGAPRRAS